MSAVPFRLASIDNCIIRNLRFPDHFTKDGVVSFKAFKDKDVDGISLTETRDRLVGMEDLEDYIEAVSANLSVKLGVAVMHAERCKEVGFCWRPDPHNDHKYGRLHVLGPKPDEFTNDLRRECATLATCSGWSRAPVL
ncbi:MAG: hypothetical protein ACK5P9_06255 [Armatimonadota bacterium]|jgi:hypothetical protein